MLRPLAPAEPSLATCAPREPRATWRCRYGFPAPSAPQGCFLNLPTEAFDEARSSPAASSPQIATDSVATEREKGVLGVNLTSRDVKECNKRGCFHIHGQAQGGATPELIAFVAEDARLRSRLLEALDTQLQARASRVPPSSYASPPPPPLAAPAPPRDRASHPSEPCLQATLPLAVQILQRKLRVGARRDAACDTPEPPEAPPDSAHEAEGWGSMCSEAVCCEGRHTSCCMVLCAKERKVDPSPGPGP